MQWHELVDQHTVPRRRDMVDFMGEAAPLWVALDDYMRNTCRCKPKLIYSHSSAQPGWYIQYEKGQQELCAVYPMRDYFIVRIIVHRTEEERVRQAVEQGSISPDAADLFHNSSSSAAGRWLMMEVSEPEVLDDIKVLTRIIGGLEKHG